MSAHGPGRGVPPIAIIGIGCRFASARGPGELWDLICSGESAVREVPRHRVELGYDIEHFHDPRPRLPGKISTPKAGFLDHPELFDPIAVGLSPRDAVSMETQQRVMIEVTWDALEDAGIPPDSLQGERVAVMIGHMAEDYSREHIAVLGEDAFHRGLDVFGVGGISRAVVSGRISFLLGITGPSFTIDTACSSSLFTTHLACQSLWSGESTLALAGGVNIFLTPEGNIALSRSGMLAGDGQCKAFDASADGFVRAEGAGMVVLRPLDDALAAGDPIYAVIRGSGTSADGRDGGHMMAPGRMGQAQAMRDAYARADMSPADIHYVETHGTGTVIGDPVELAALGDVMGPGRPDDQPLLVASVKGTLGHAESASGVAGLIKAALAVHHRELPPQLHFREPSPHIPWDELPIRVQTEHTAWPYPGPARAGVNSFGISGTNAHVILESAPEQPAVTGRDSSRPYLLPISGHTPKAREQMAERYRDWLRDPAGPALEDAAHTLSLRRSHRGQRLCVVGRSRDELVAELDAFLEAPGNAIHASAETGRKPGVAFLFPGQGAQWAGMGRGLCAEEPVFRDAIERWDAAFRHHVDWSLFDVLRRGDSAAFERLDVVQPVLIAFSAALAELWRSFGVQPDLVIGQSLGEIAAAFVGGQLDLEQAARLACQRGLQVARASGRGAMGIVALTAEAVEAEIASFGGRSGRVEIAGVNSPTNTIVSGDREAVAALIEHFERREVFARPLNVDFASHCFHMDPLLEDFTRAIGAIEPLTGDTPCYSTVTGGRIEGSELTGDYWVRNLRAPVRLADAVSQAMEAGAEIFVELAPHPALGQSLRDTAEASDRSVSVVAPLRRDQDESLAVRRALGELFVRGVALDFPAIQGQGRTVRAPLYAFQRERYWFGERRREDLQRRTHPVLGVAIQSSVDTAQRIYESILDPDVVPFIGDAALAGAAQVTPALCIEAALAVAADRSNGSTLALDAIELSPSCPLPEHHRMVLQAVLREARSESLLQLACRATHPEADWSPLLRCTLGEGSSSLDASLEQARAQCPEPGSPQALYRELEDSGLALERSLRTVRELYLGDGQALALVSLHHSAAPEAAAYHAHPALLSGCLQSVSAALAHDGAPGAVSTTQVESIEIETELGPEVWCHVQLRAEAGRAPDVVADLALLRADGRCVGRIRGLRGRRLSRETTQSVLYEVGWRAQPELSIDPEAPRSWLVVGDDRAEAQIIAAGLAGRGCTTSVRSPGAILEAHDLRPDRALGLALISPRSSPEPFREDPLQAVAAQAARHGGVGRIAVVTHRLHEVDGRPAAPCTGDACRFEQAALLVRDGVAEHALCLDIDDVSAPDAVARALVAPAREDRLAIRRGELFAARLREIPPGTDVHTGPALEAAGGRPFVARLVVDGDLDAVELVEAQCPEPGPGEVLLEVRAAALSFLDLLRSLGADDRLGRESLGLECAGVVRAVASDVRGLRPGDEVFGFVPGSAATHCLARAELLAPKPPGLSFETATATPLAFATAELALQTARIRSGESVLVHSAASAVGQATIQLAAALGAEVFATAGSERRRAALKTLGVSQIADSRSLDFADAIKSWTQGRGVDVVIDTLASTTARESVALLAPGGRLVDLRAPEATRRDEIDLRGLGRNRSYASVDLPGMLNERPAALAALLHQVGHRLAAESIRAIPTTRFSLAHADRALRFMAQERHLGKVVLDVDDRERTPIRPLARRRLEHLDGVVLVSGAGPSDRQQVADWLTQQGATDLVLQGEAEDPEPVIAALERSGRSLRGVVHIASGCFDREPGAVALDLEESRARELHAATAHRDLEFFGLVVPGDGMLGHPDRSLTSRACFQALARRRRAQALPAACVAIAPVGRVGGPAGGDALAALLLTSRDALLATAPLSAADLGESLASSALVAELELSGAVASSGLRDELLGLEGDARGERVRAVTLEALAGVLSLSAEARKDIDPHAPLNRLGIDSLMGLELRVGLERDLGIEIPPSFFVEAPSVNELSELLLARLAASEETRA